MSPVAPPLGVCHVPLGSVGGAPKVLSPGGGRGVHGSVDCVVVVELLPGMKRESAKDAYVKVASRFLLL